MGKAGGISFPFHNSFSMRNNFPKELFNHKLQLVTHWRGKRNKSVMKNQLFCPSRELKEAAFFYYYLAHPGVWLISAFMAHQDVLVSLLILRTVRSVFLLFSGLALHFLAASNTLLNAGGTWGSRLLLGDKKVTEPKGTSLASFCSPPETTSKFSLKQKFEFLSSFQLMGVSGFSRAGVFYWRGSWELVVLCPWAWKKASSEVCRRETWVGWITGLTRDCFAEVRCVQNRLGVG